MHLDKPVEKGYPDPEQHALHAAWRSQGRRVFVVYSPAEAVAAVEGVAAELRALGMQV